MIDSYIVLTDALKKNEMLAPEKKEVINETDILSFNLVFNPQRATECLGSITFVLTLFVNSATKKLYFTFTIATMIAFIL